MTGGGTGLGLVTANALAANGAKVYITGRREGPLKEAERKSENGKGGEIIAVVADLSNKEGILGEPFNSDHANKQRYVKKSVARSATSTSSSIVREV